MSATLRHCQSTKCKHKLYSSLPLGGDSDPGSESDDETRLRELGAKILLGGTGKDCTVSRKLNLWTKYSILINAQRLSLSLPLWLFKQ